MKKLAFIFSILLLSVSAFAQKNAPVTAPDMPIDTTTKLVSYTNKVEQTGVTHQELFRRAMKWIKQYYPNPTGVIQEADSVNGKIVGKAAYDTHKTLKNGVKAPADRIQYTITFLFKDGKYKYEITKLNIKAASYIPIEKYFDEKAENHEDHFNSLNDADDYFMAMKHSIEERMAKPSAEAKKSDW